MKEQFNLRLPPKIAAKVRADARRNYRTLDDVSAVIFTDFFDAWSVQERAKFYEKYGRKTVGRKVTPLKDKFPRVSQ